MGVTWGHMGTDAQAEDRWAERGPSHARARRVAPSLAPALSSRLLRLLGSSRLNGRLWRPT
eukprot:2218444-Prymnesium_polylepis.1